MGAQFSMGPASNSLIVVSSKCEPWLSVLEQAGWKCQRCDDLRKADVLLHEIGPCVGLVDLSQDEFSLNGIANIVSCHKHVRWIAFIREAQVNSNTICQFIVNFCIDFFIDPIPDAQLISTVGHQLGMLKLEKKVWPDLDRAKDMGLVGEAVSIKRLREQAKRMAITDVNMLIYGENGSGKGRIAKAVHDMSMRYKGPFVAVNCCALSESKMEEEVFGIETEKESYLERASNGTLFLDDILALSHTQQRNLLRFMQEGKIETANGSKKLNVRVLVACSSDIEKALVNRKLNDELYHYINVLRINVPSLKERAGDISILAKQFLRKFSREYNSQAKGFSDEAIKMMTQYHWPGNIRELSNQVRRAVLTSDSVIIDSPQLDLPLASHGKLDLKSIRKNAEKEALSVALEANNGQILFAARELGISRATMYRLLNKHDLVADIM